MHVFIFVAMRHKAMGRDSFVIYVCIALHCVALHCVALYCVVLYCIVTQLQFNSIYFLLSLYSIVIVLVLVLGMGLGFGFQCNAMECHAFDRSCMHTHTECAILRWVFHHQTVALQAFGWNGQDVGHFLSAVGAAVIISQAWSIVNTLSKGPRSGGKSCCQTPLFGRVCAVYSLHMKVRLPTIFCLGIACDARLHLSGCFSTSASANSQGARTLGGARSHCASCHQICWLCMGPSWALGICSSCH